MTTTILNLIKARLGITSIVRDVYITAIIDGIITELEDEKGITVDAENANHLMFIVDYTSWRYNSVNNMETAAGQLPMPRHLQFRLHNLMIKGEKK